MRQQRPARRCPTVTDAATTTFMAERAAAEAQRTSSSQLSKPAPQAHGPPPTGRNCARVRQKCPRPPTNPRRQPTYSKCPAAAAIASANAPSRGRPCAHTRESTSARAPPPRAPPRHRTMRSPPGPPPPPVHTTPPHPPTPTPPPKAAAMPRDSGGSAGPTRSSGSCKSGPGQSVLSRAWSTGPARGRWRTAASSQRGAGCRSPHGKPCWPMRSTPWESTPATSPRPRTTRMSSGACGRPSGKRNETASACGTSPKAQLRTHEPPCHPTSVGAPTPAAPTAPQEPCPPHSMTRLTPQPAAPQPNPVTQPATAAGRHTRPRPENTKQSRSRRTPTHTPTSTATPNGTEPKPAAVKTA